MSRATQEALKQQVGSGRSLIFPMGQAIDGAYLDAPLGLVLCFDGLPCAVAGISSYFGGAMIKQLQVYTLEQRYKILRAKAPQKSETKIVTIKNYEPLRGFRWERLLVRSVEEILSILGIEECAVQSAENNKWVRKRRFPIDRAKLRYDTVAERMGYELGEDGNFCKSLTQ